MVQRVKKVQIVQETFRSWGKAYFLMMTNRFAWEKDNDSCARCQLDAGDMR